VIDAAGVRPLVWFAGERADVPEVMRMLDCFVLPSIGEGISNTILEAMASGVPVVATRVGGNPELVSDGTTGALVGASDPDAMARAILGYYADPARMAAHATAARRRAVEGFSLQAMVEHYHALYSRSLTERGHAPSTAWSAGGVH
jgi:glycosyltransferase involved in cell wall biosynthesis